MQYSLSYAPFGETYAENGTIDRSFTGQTQDVIASSQGIYDFLLRQHAASQGPPHCGMVPDPAGLTAVDITNPQTWNRYAYVGNDPLDYFDPDGLAECTLNVGISFPGSSTTQFMNGVENQLSTLFGPDVALKFTSGVGDVNLDISSLIGMNSGGTLDPNGVGGTPIDPNTGQPRNYSFVDLGLTANFGYFLNKQTGQSAGLAPAVGRVAAHELGHELFLGHNALGGIMAAKANPFQNLGFSETERTNLLTRCQYLQKAKSNGSHAGTSGSGGGAGGGFAFWNIQGYWSEGVFMGADITAIVPYSPYRLQLRGY